VATMRLELADFPVPGIRLGKGWYRIAGRTTLSLSSFGKFLPRDRVF
jgi:hypothetical protein